MVREEASEWQGGLELLPAVISNILILLRIIHLGDSDLFSTCNHTHFSKMVFQ